MMIDIDKDDDDIDDDNDDYNDSPDRIASFTFFAGTGVGVFAAGTLSDKIGRRVTVLLFIALFVAR